MGQCGYTINTTADVALSAATAKTILMVINGTNAAVILDEVSVSFDGTSPTAEPVTVEIVKSTQAGAGSSTSQTPVQVRGAARTVQASGARNYSAEPTVLTVIKEFLIHPQAGVVYQLPLGREIEQIASGNGVGIRCTAPAVVNARGFMEWEE